MTGLIKKIRDWFNSPVGGWDKYWKRETAAYSQFAQRSVHAAVQSYLIKWQMYYHQTKEYDTNVCMTLEQKICQFLEDTCQKLCK